MAFAYRSLSGEFRTTWLSWDGQILASYRAFPFQTAWSPASDGSIFAFRATETSFQSYSAILVKYDRTGQILWQSSDNYPILGLEQLRPPVPTADGGCLIWGRDLVYSFDANGGLRWSRTLRTVFSILIEGQDGFFYHVEMGNPTTKLFGDGREAWTKSFPLGIPPPGGMPTAIPSPDGGLFIMAPDFSTGDRILAKISGDGELKWKKPHPWSADGSFPATAIPEGLILTKSSASGASLILLENATGRVVAEKLFPSIPAISSITSNGSHDFLINHLNVISRISVFSAPQFSSYATNQLAMPESNVTLRAESTNNWGILRYQWRFQGTNIPGETNSTLVLTNLGLSQYGRYSVVLSNSFGLSVESPPAQVMQTDAQLLRRMHPSIEVTGIPGKRYRAEYTEDLSDPDWKTGAEFMLSQNPHVWVDTSIQIPTYRYYRVLKID